MKNAGSVDQCVQAVLADHVREGRIDGVGARHVQDDPIGREAICREPWYLQGHPPFITIGEDDTPAIRCQPLGRSQPDAAGAANDEYRLHA